MDHYRVIAAAGALYHARLLIDYRESPSSNWTATLESELEAQLGIADQHGAGHLLVTLNDEPRVIWAIAEFAILQEKIDSDRASEADRERAQVALDRVRQAARRVDVWRRAV